VNGAFAARALAAAGYGQGVVSDVRREAAQALAAELGWRAGTTRDALRQDVACCVTPGFEPVVEAGDLHPGEGRVGAVAPGDRHGTGAHAVADAHGS